MISPAPAGCCWRCCRRCSARKGPALVAVIEPLARSAHEQPELSSLLASAAYHLYRHEYPAMLRDAVEAREFLDGQPDDVRAPAEVVIALFEMAAARFAADVGTVRQLAQLGGRPAGPDAAQADPRRPALPRHRGDQPRRRRRSGAVDFDDAERNLASVEPDALELGLLFVHLNALGHHAVLDALQGRLRQAGRRARDGLAIIDKRGWAAEPQALASFLARGLVGLARSDLQPPPAAHQPRASRWAASKPIARCGWHWRSPRSSWRWPAVTPTARCWPTRG